MSTHAEQSSTRTAALLERAGEWLNPLLVKECRQSLKSRQFSTTFTLVVVFSWLWSIYGIVMLGPNVAYHADGAEMFYGYYLILAFPLLLIVPYSAYRSLIAEREDNTFELVAITTLKPRQIVAGKLGSAVAQMVVYLSVAAPCLAFTYLLRGIDVFTICLILFYTVLASLGLSLCALLLATIAKERHWQVMVSVLIVVGLFNVFMQVIALCHSTLRVSQLPFHSLEFWISNLQIQTAFWSCFALVYLAAGAQLTSAAENRSTPLRVAMLVQQSLLAGWLGFDMYSEANGLRTSVVREYVFVYTVMSLLYWFVAGAFMLGESTELSSRAKRSLPTSFLGRVLTTWFNPGPDTGFMFAIGNGLATVVFGLIGLCVAGHLGFIRTQWVTTWLEAVAVLMLMLGYLIIYLGVGNILLHLARRVTRVTLATSVLIVMLIVLCGVAAPYFIRYVMDYRGAEYMLLHVSDPIWSSMAAIDQRYAGIYLTPLCWIIFPIAAVVFVMNLILVVPALKEMRIARPLRVEEEDAARLAAAQPELQPTSPWGG